MGLDNIVHKGTGVSTPLFIWPLQQAAGFTDCGYYGISAHVDQDTNATSILDYNCGTTTYDTHRGTDIFIFPFPFYKMDHDQVEVIAAAPGTIINKVDGNFDKNCAANSLTANYIVVQHSDGSLALYLHMKNGSLTSKIVGDNVVAGEFLGRVGSSGSSSGPHLHFEVWSGTTVATRNDPWSGTCNTLNPNTWWITQPAYKSPMVLKTTTGLIAPVIPACPETETPNDTSCFATGTASGIFAMYLRDETNGTTVDLNIKNASGTIVNSWIHNCTADIIGSYWYWTKPLPATPGDYTFNVTYNGSTCSKTFNIGCTTGVGTVENSMLRVSPNPAGPSIELSADNIINGDYRLSLQNMMGQTVLQDHMLITNNELHKVLSTEALPQGIYFLLAESGASRMLKKIVKE